MSEVAGSHNHSQEVFHVRLGEPDTPVDLLLLEQLAEHLRSAFREIVREQSGDEKVQVRFLVQDARKGSIVLALLPALIGADMPPAAEIARTLISDINALRTETARPTMSANLLGQYREMVKIGQKAGRLEIGFEGNESKIGPENQVAFEAAVRDQPEPDTHIVGTIESVNIHRRPWHFGLYTKLDGQRVECRFEDSMLEDVLRLMEEKAVADVVGEGKFAAVGITPRSIELTQPPRGLAFDADELRSFHRSAGIANEGESAADALLRVREERSQFG